MKTKRKTDRPSGPDKATPPRTAAREPNANNVHLLIHGAEAGGITKADIERRAQELALIRTGSEDYADEDLANAARELMGADTPPSSTEDEATTRTASRDPSEPIGDAGNEQPVTEPPDENAEPERLTLQGVEEAQHDLMVEARRRKARE